ncbi:MAG: hypothetical protein ACKOOA_09895 [Sediminibacterium sp.]
MYRTELTIFKVLTYLLLPIGFFFGMVALMMLVVAIANVQLLLPLFLMACFTIYIFTSFRFTQRIVADQPVSGKLRDWMRVNGFVTIFMSILFLMNAAAILFLPEQKLVEMIQPTIDTMGTLADGITAEQMVGRLKSFSVFLLVMSVTLLVHLVINFRLQKIYASPNEKY